MKSFKSFVQEQFVKEDSWYDATKGIDNRIKSIKSIFSKYKKDKEDKEDKEDENDIKYPNLSNKASSEMAIMPTKGSASSISPLPDMNLGVEKIGAYAKRQVG